MKYSLSIHTILTLLTLSDALAFNPRAVSFRRRAPEPLSFMTCCMKIPDVASDPPSVTKTSTEETDTIVSQPEFASSKLKSTSLDPEDFGAYPTRVKNPGTTLGGLRFVVGVIALNPASTKVILIKDHHSTEGWRLPESGWSQDEFGFEDAVKREAWETAGIEVDRTKPIYVGEDETNAATKDSWSLYYRFQVEDNQMKETWPGAKRWQREWATYREAKERLAKDHPEQWEMLKDSGLRKKATLQEFISEDPKIADNLAAGG